MPQTLCTQPSNSHTPLGGMLVASEAKRGCVPWSVSGRASQHKTVSENYEIKFTDQSELDSVRAIMGGRVGVVGGGGGVAAETSFPFWPAAFTFSMSTKP
jgi:hypothetical protein